MAYLVPTDTERDLQDFRARHLLAESRVEARTSLLDKAKVKRRRVGDRLDVSCIAVQLGVGSGNCGELTGKQSRERLRVRGAEIRIGCAPVASNTSSCLPLAASGS